MPKTPKSDKKTKTLFSFFQTTPKSSGKDISHVISPEANTQILFDKGDLVWAKLEGHPWWPAMVTQHPKEGTIYKIKKSIKKSKKNLKGLDSRLFHVQFFEDPPSRGWVKEKFMKIFEGQNGRDCERGGTFFSMKVSWGKSVSKAVEALDMTLEQRLSLVQDISSDDDNMDMEENDEQEDNDVDSSLLDDDNEIKSSDESKENLSPDIDETLAPIRTRRNKLKKRRLIESDDEKTKNHGDSEDEFKPDLISCESESSSSEEDDEASIEIENQEEENTSDLVSPEPKTSKKRKRPSRLNKGEANLNSSTPSSSVKFLQTSKMDSFTSDKLELTPSSKIVSVPGSKLAASTKNKLASFSVNNSISSNVQSVDGELNFPHLSYKFLDEANQLDSNKRPKHHFDFDPKTLYIPQDFINKQTPAMKQWWQLKAQYFDTVLFFKLGKFYELFHMDAVIGVKELGLIFMKGDHAHCGFPEISYGRYADQLVQRGYKVARIEQTETPDMMTQRISQMGSASRNDKVVKREICSVISRGTKRSSFIDGDQMDANNNYLLAIKEQWDESSQSRFGICFVDVTIGMIHVGEFFDDRYASRLRTLLSHYPPVEILYERGKLSEKVQKLFNGPLLTATKVGLRTGSEFWLPSVTLNFILSLTESQKEEITSSVKVNEEETEKSGDSDMTIEGKRENENNTDGRFINKIRFTIEEGNILGTKAHEDWKLGLSSLGAIIWYLQRHLIDEEILSLGLISQYHPPDYISLQANTSFGDSTSSHKLDNDNITKEHTEKNDYDFVAGKKFMILDGVTLSNLDVLVNSSTGTQDATLLQLLDKTATPFGKRLLKQWVCTPLVNLEGINDRLDAVADLLAQPELSQDLHNGMSKLPDLQRLINKIHTLGLSKRSLTHPDSRAIFFEDATYSKRKIIDFLTCLDGFETLLNIIRYAQPYTKQFKSRLLKSCVSQMDNKGNFPQLESHLQFFQTAFDHISAKADGVIKPTKGVNKEYDRAMIDKRDVEQGLQEYLETQKKILKCRELSYFGTAKNRFQIEIPDRVIGNVPKSYELTSQRKGFRRYKTAEIESMFGRLCDAESRCEVAQNDTMRCIFAKFDEQYMMLKMAIDCASVLDVLMSFASYSSSPNLCRPIIKHSKEPFLSMLNGRHPCLAYFESTSSNFIPNSLNIGRSQDDCVGAKALLLTGANMGGKSTFIRQVGLISILAQLGCYVPCDYFEMSPIDRIFTRLGASDNILAGESTLYVELSETASILKHASLHSLVLLDELGRGTATYDGTAIASSVLKEISEEIGCRVIFSTHYHTLLQQFENDRNISAQHMACMVETEETEDGGDEVITFLYKLKQGACPNSYGFNAARLAQIPKEVIKLGQQKAKELEEFSKLIRIFGKLYNLEKKDLDQISSILED